MKKILMLTLIAYTQLNYNCECLLALCKSYKDAEIQTENIVESKEIQTENDTLDQETQASAENRFIQFYDPTLKDFNAIQEVNVLPVATADFQPHFNQQVIVGLSTISTRSTTSSTLMQRNYLYNEIYPMTQGL